MIHFDLPKEKSSIIKVIGVGGGGSNAVNHMFSQNIEGVNFIICNTDAQAIATSRVPNKVQLGPHLTQGLGAGANPDIGRQATEESLEEIKQILEVNTKMAFITAGMGGGTGTGGAPIISKICKDLGILTVGIITTPFSYEGKKRQLQADEGIKMMKQYVDTLLVISNDKLRHQFGNLKMKEAFAKADNVLATAAKCITDVINSTGQINVDFADVCTVMRNGGVAILGNATAKGDNRAQKAIEEALNSPLLNDNDIRGAKWILININSSEGEHEFTMDEVETIQNYLLSQAGEGSDVIMGLGYDNSLGANLGITLIATGFEYKDPFVKPAEVKPAPKKEEKILMPLGLPVEERKLETRPVLTASETIKETQGNKELAKTKESPVVEQAMLAPLPDALQPKLVDMTAPSATPSTAGATIPMNASATPLTLFTSEEPRRAYGEMKAVSVTDTESRLASADKPAEKVERAPRIEWVLSPEPEISQPVQSRVRESENNTPPSSGTSSSTAGLPSSGASGGYLARPSNIYAEDPFIERPATVVPGRNNPIMEPVRDAIEPVRDMSATDHSGEDEIAPDMKLVFRDGVQKADEPAAGPAGGYSAGGASSMSGTNGMSGSAGMSGSNGMSGSVGMTGYAGMSGPSGMTGSAGMSGSSGMSGSVGMSNNDGEEHGSADDNEDLKRRAADRINKLRNLSFNINAADPNNEFETVPAYIRRNLELYNTISNVENFYSNYEVKTDENNNTEISTINTFLDGKRPD